MNPEAFKAKIQADITKLITQAKQSGTVTREALNAQLHSYLTRMLDAENAEATALYGPPFTVEAVGSPGQTKAGCVTITTTANLNHPQGRHLARLMAQRQSDEENPE